MAKALVIKRLKNKFFNHGFAAFIVWTTMILLGKTGPDSSRKEAFARAKAMVTRMNEGCDLYARL